MSELKPFEVIMRIDFAASDKEQVCAHAEKVQELVRCKDCKWKNGAECVRFADVRPFPNDFCSRAERRTDE